MVRSADYHLSLQISEAVRVSEEFFSQQRYHQVLDVRDQGDGSVFMLVDRKVTFSSWGWKFEIIFNPAEDGGTNVHIDVPLNGGYGGFAHMQPNKVLNEWAARVGTKPVKFSSPANCIVGIICMVVLFIILFSLPYMLLS